MSSFNLWINEEDKDLLTEIDPLELREYSKGLLIAQLGDPGSLSRFDKKFVFGRRRMWPGEAQKVKIPFVHIKRNSAYADGLILIPYPADDFEFNLGMRRRDQTTKKDRIGLLGSEGEDFVVRAFRTYNHSLVNKFNERDQHLLLYSRCNSAQPESL